jgi:hypothetical protein
MIAFAANDGRLVVRDAATDQLLLARRFPRHDVLSVDGAPGERRILMVMDPWRGRRWLATVAVGNPASRPHRIRLPHRFRSTRWRPGGASRHVTRRTEDRLHRIPEGRIRGRTAFLVGHAADGHRSSHDRARHSTTTRPRSQRL